MPRSHRMRQRWILSVLVVFMAMLAAAGWLGGRALAAQRHLEAAQTDLTAARVAILDGDLATARTAVTRAGDRTAQARNVTSDPVWRLAAALPGVGATPETVRGVAQAADDVARDVLPAALDGADVLNPDTLRGPDGAIDLGAVHAATPAITDAANRAAAVTAALSQLPMEDTVGRVSRRTSDVVDDSAEVADALSDAARALAIAPVLLGEDQPRRYLFLVQQTSEARGTGGIIGGFVEVEVAQGRLTPVSAGSNADLRNGLIEAPPGLPEGFEQLYDGSGLLRYWQNANLSPDVPVVAQILEARWEAQGGAPLDGVVLLDAVALSLILQGSDPLPLADGEVAPEHLVEYLAVGQYRDFAPATGDLLDRGRDRKDQLEEVALTAAERLVAGGGNTRMLLSGLVEAVRSGHVHVASDDPALAPLLAETGVDGALPAGPAPVAYAVVNNATAGKLDYFLERRVTYTAGDCTGGRRPSTVTVELRNDVPDTELPPYLTINNTPDGRTESRDLELALSVYVTRGADLVGATVDGGPVAPEQPDGPVVTAAQEAGLPRYTVRLTIPPGQSRTLTLELDEPVAPGEARVPEQPLSRPLVSRVDVPVCR